MARNSGKANTETTEAPAEVETVETVETPATEGTEAPAAAAAAPAAEEVVNLDAFKAATTEAVEGADTSTGDVAPALSEKVLAAYRDLPGKGKREAKKALQELMREAVNGRNIIKAKSLMTLADAVDNVSTKAKVERTPVDPTQAFAERVVALRLAGEVFVSNVPEGVDDAAWRAKANELVASTKDQVKVYGEYLTAKANVAEGAEAPAEPEGINEVVKAAFRIASGKGGGMPKARAASSSPRATFDGPRRDIKKHIASAFADLEPGAFLTVAQIREHKSAEYGEDAPSSGAISARLFPTSGKVTLDGAGVEPAEEGGKKGARKLA